MKKLSLVLLLLASSASAQNNTAVSGTVTDPGGVPWFPASVIACLSPVTTDPTANNGQHLNTRPGANYCIGPANTAADGSWSMNLVPNASISPAATQYVFTASAVGVPPPSGYGPVTVSSSATAVTGTTQIITFSSVPNLIRGAGGGGACVGANCFVLQNYGGFADTREVLDASWSGGGSTITCPNNDCTFVPADAGKLCWAMPTNNNNPGPSAPGTLTYISAQSASCTAAAVIGGASANGLFTWGHDDTSALIKATNALYTQPKCGALILPAARMMLAQGVSYTGSIAADCNVNITGQGYATVIEMEPGFNFSAVTTNVGCVSLGCFWNSSASSAYLYFTLSGEYQSLSGISTAPASSLFTIGPGAYTIGLNFFNWATSASNSPIGINVTGSGAFGLGTAIINWANGNFTCANNNNYCIGFADGGTGVTKATGGSSLDYDYSGTYNSLSVNGGEFHGFGTATVAASSGTSGQCAIGSSVYLDGAKIGRGTPGSLATGWLFNTSGSGNQCILVSQNSTYNGGATAGPLASQGAGIGQFIDLGNNTFSGGPVTFSGTYTNLTALNVQGACTGVATASQTLGLYGTGPNVTLTTCTSTTIGSGIVMNKNFTIYELLANSSAGGVNGSSGVVTVLKNGSTQSMTCTIGTGTSCQDGATAHQVTGTNGDRISIQFTTQGADTLAGVKATLVIE